MPEGIAFARDGSYQEQAAGEQQMRYGSYIVQGNKLVLHPAVQSEGYEDENFEMTWVGADKLNLKPIPPPEAKDKVAPEMLDAMTYRMRRAGPAEKLNKDVVAASLDPERAPGKPTEAQTESQSCLANVRQISMSVMMYSQDYDEVYPGSDWQSAITPYVKNTAIFDCPVVAKNGEHGGYALNEDLVGTAASRIKDPATVTAIFESIVLQPSALASPQTMAKVGRHPEGDSTGYADGHVKAVP